MNPTLKAGSILGHYEIHSQLGVGGMGEVYRARDSRLNREVAIKVLPQEFVNDSARLTRFQREAQVLAALNHPNIAAIYGLEEQNGFRALVLELVEGPTLADRVKLGPLPLDEALEIARQIADALEVAHERGIVHRDLKPANIKITGDRIVKVLDFGLAKVFADETSHGDISESPTMLKATQTGTVLGTAAYMSPEQAKGKFVDKRSDIWAFGCVLFEMISGKRAFSGETFTDTLASVVRDEPAWNDLPPQTPDGVHRLLRRCLTKDPKQRLRDIGDAKYEFDHIDEHSPTVVAGPTGSRWRIPVLVTLLLIAAFASGALIMRGLNRGASSTPSVIRLTQTFHTSLDGSGTNRNRLTISPDGTKLVYVANNKLYLRSLDSLDAKEIPGSEDARGPFFSHDGEWVAFFRTSQLKKLPISGGKPTFIGSVDNVVGTSWGRDNTILIGGVHAGILRIPANGGDPETVVKPSSGLSYAHPQFLPDGQTFLYQRGAPGVPTDNELVMRSLTGDDETVILRGAFAFRYLSSGHIVYATDTTAQSADLSAVAFDIRARKVTGVPVIVVRNVQLSTATNRLPQFVISDTGSLAYIPASTAVRINSHLAMVSPSGQVSRLPAEEREYSDPRVSPDGRFVAAHLQGDQDDVWITDVSRGTLTRLSFNVGEDETPAWSPDGRSVAWAASRGDVQRGIFRRAADGSGNEELIWKSEKHSHVRDWTPDGRSLILEFSDPFTQNDIWRLDLTAQTVTPFLQTQFNERCSRLSPDGKWLAYVSNESGRAEIYVQSFPEAGSKLQVSTSGGDQPIWSRDGRKLFFRGEGKIQEITFQPGSPPSVNGLRSLFDDHFENPQIGTHTGYDVFPDGRFLMIQSEKKPDTSVELIVVVNWMEELKRLVRSGTQ